MAVLQPNLHQMKRPAPDSWTEHWYDDLDLLLTGGMLTGYALITVSGQCEKAAGKLLEEFSTQAPLPASAKQALDPFVEADGDPTSFTFCGEKVMVFFHSGRSYYGISHNRRVGIGICRLPFGVLIIAFDRKFRPQTVVPRVEDICDRMWR